MGSGFHRPLMLYNVGEEVSGVGIRAFIFDMDGTILHTLPDLVIAANEALVQMGFPIRTYDEILSFMGRGGAHMIEHALPSNAPDAAREKAFDLWRDIYISSDYANTVPFPGVEETLWQLRDAGAKTAVLSNKFHEGTLLLADRCLPGLFDIVRGDIPPAPRKPDPTTLLQMLDELGVSAEETAYVGDTLVDVRVARNAGVMAVGVSWGYDASSPLPIAELDVYINNPGELLTLL